MVSTIELSMKLVGYDAIGHDTIDCYLGTNRFCDFFGLVPIYRTYTLPILPSALEMCVLDLEAGILNDLGSSEARH